MRKQESEQKKQSPKRDNEKVAIIGMAGKFPEASNVEEFWIVGFIEEKTNRSRAYLVSDVKIDTVALFIAKTVAKHTTICTPYYHVVGWEWLDKFYDH